MKILSIVLTLVIATPVFGAIKVSLSDNFITFDVIPDQSTPLQSGFASYTTGSVGAFNGIMFAGSASVNLITAVTSNTLFDNNGDAIADSLVDHLITSESEAGTILGFGNPLGSGNGFTLAGGTLVLEFHESLPYELPESPVSNFVFGTSYDPGTTGTTGDLVPVPEPRAYAMLAGLTILGLAALRRRR